MLYFIVNETARTGKGVGVWRQVQIKLREKKIPYKVHMTEYKGHATELAKMISEKKEKDICITVVGGDGTLNEVINGITDFENVRCSLIPAGSGNDFAQNMQISKNPQERIEHILECVEKGAGCCERIDLGEAVWSETSAPRKYAISSGVGMDALVCKKMATSKIKVFMNKIGLGKLSYLIVTFQSLISMETSDMAVKADDAGTRIFKRAIFAAAMNTRAEGGGVPMTPKASVQDGLLSACLVYRYSKFGALLRLPFLAVGAHEGFKGFEIFDSKEISISLKKPMTLHTDGEYLGEVTAVTYRCLPGMLRFIV